MWRATHTYTPYIYIISLERERDLTKIPSFHTVGQPAKLLRVKEYPLLMVSQSDGTSPFEKISSGQHEEEKQDMRGKFRDRKSKMKNSKKK